MNSLIGIRFAPAPEFGAAAKGVMSPAAFGIDDGMHRTVAPMDCGSD
jgi:hypothetical protein